MTKRRNVLPALITATAIALLPAPSFAQVAEYGTFATYTLKGNRFDHRIDYAIWTEALSHFVISMGPPLR